jgi:hypothetical protein
VTSDRRQCANVANAKSSTGPKTAAGKARSAQNAFRHGLNVPVRSDPLLAPEIEAMAHGISGPNADAETMEGARRKGRGGSPKPNLTSTGSWSTPTSCRGTSADYSFGACIWLSALVSASCLSKSIRSRSYLAPSLPKAKKKLAVILEEKISELAALDRYERRALSRRKAAIRNFDAARTLANHAAPTRINVIYNKHGSI